jgi:two-component system, cell cycle response regulator DivK
VADSARPVILLVEDHEDNRKIYRTILVYSGFDVLEATDGRSGVEIALHACPDLILMDMSIPHIDGWEATRILKSDPRTSAIPVVALTAHSLDEDREHAIEAGCDGYLAKPVEPRAVVEEIRRLLEASSAA